jgi:hypothetical protein
MYRTVDFGHEIIAAFSEKRKDGNDCEKAA